MARGVKGRTRAGRSHEVVLPEGREYGFATMSYHAHESVTLFFDYFKTHFSVDHGALECVVEWLEFDQHGLLQDQQEIHLFSHFRVEKGFFYHMRIHVHDPGDCERITILMRVKSY